MMPLLHLENISAGYGENIILKHFHLSVEKGKLVSLLGPSGCGKTTTLRLIGGFSEPVEGKIMFDGHDYTKLPAHKRNFGFVFQSYALFPNMTIFDNVAFGLKMRKIGKDEIQRSVPKILETVDLKGYENRFPKELSGGQRQRVALARALVIQPSLLLMDEPLSNLDAKLRIKMRVEIRRIQQQLGITTIYVTHDQEECFAISDEVAIMNKGVIEQMNSPENIYKYPKTEFIARFVGFENFFTLTKADIPGKYRAVDQSVFAVKDEAEGTHFKACIRPEDVKMRPADTSGENLVKGKIKVATYLGKQYQYNIETKLGGLVVKSEEENHKINENVALSIPPEKMILIKSND